MDLNAYKQLLKDTFNTYYPKYYHIDIVHTLLDSQIATMKSQVSIFNSVDISDIEIAENVEKIKRCMDNNLLTYKVVEQQEISRGYKYSVLFEYGSIDEEDMGRIITDNKVIPISDYDAFDDNFSYEIHKPIFCRDRNKVYLKFSRQIRMQNIIEEVFVNVRYPILLILHQEYNVAEIRFDILNFNGNDEFYKDNILIISTWLQEYLNIELFSLDIDRAIKHILSNKRGEVAEIARSLGLKDERSAVLNAAGSDTYTLPFIGDLQEIIDNNKEIFEESSKCLKLIQDYIEMVQKTSDCYWRILSWKSEIKNRIVNIKVIFSYRGTNYNLIHFYNPERNDMERMNYVTGYIIGCKGEAEELLPVQEE